MTTIGFLACETTLPGSGARRRADAFEHDLMVAALEPALAARGLAMRVIDWEAPLEAFAGLDAVLLGTAWNYQDRAAVFVAKLEALEARGIAVHNPPGLVRWNMTKTYLRELEEAGAATIPTLWLDEVTGEDIRAAFAQFGCEKLVVKRQVGAGAEGQVLLTADEPPGPDWRFGRPAMVQPFLPAIETQGEVSFVFVAGEFSHALTKRAASGDYRIQSIYGGTESRHYPAEDEVEAARSVLAAIPFAAPLYARIDMVRTEDGLLLMEAELIEPYLYPEQGERLGEHIARALARMTEPEGSRA
ncbi:hypothetical protein [Erythrobacter sp.]|uniref:ATP-grasp domain-containing protein n=1 Tax=Erythrobacter sp. TaxID=1042 RepID=UPI001425E0DB|nr:hypothetical protein [Erythrobacter sp.]QIQ86646.1 MAG: hypothetical protein G9473_08070 [Erythrobacter sp.]